MKSQCGENILLNEPTFLIANVVSRQWLILPHWVQIHRHSLIGLIWCALHAWSRYARTPSLDMQTWLTKASNLLNTSPGMKLVSVVKSIAAASSDNASISVETSILSPSSKPSPFSSSLRFVFVIDGICSVWWNNMRRGALSGQYIFVQC